MSSPSSSSSRRSSSFRTALPAAARARARLGDAARASRSRRSIALLPLALPNNYTYEIAILVGLNAIVCVGLNLLIGYAGQISLGPRRLLRPRRLRRPRSSPRATAGRRLISLPIAVAAVALLAWLVGRPILRLKGHYLAMATLGLGIIVSVVLATEDWLTGGPDGMSVPPLVRSRPAKNAWYWIVGGALLAHRVAGAEPDRLAARARLARAARLGGRRAAAIGIDAARHKLAAFVLSAAIAAVAGALTAHYSGFITPAKASFLHSIELVTMVVFGGMASTFGAVVGAAVLTTLPQLLTVFKEYEMVVLRRADDAHHDLHAAGPGADAGESACCCAPKTSTKRFGGVHAVRGRRASSSRRARCTSIIGPNGAGKTTLLNLLSGIYVPTRGEYSSTERDLTGAAAAPLRRRRHRPHVPEPADLLQHERARERDGRAPGCTRRCGLAAALLRLPRARARRARVPRQSARELLEFVGLARWADARVRRACPTAR